MTAGGVFNLILGRGQAEYDHIIKTKTLTKIVELLIVSDQKFEINGTNLSLKTCLEQKNALGAMKTIQALEFTLNELLQEGVFMKRESILKKAKEMQAIVEKIKENVVLSMRSGNSEKILNSCFSYIGQLMPYLNGKKLINDIPDMIILIGTPGSGKSFINDKGFADIGVKHLCSDKYFEPAMRKAGLSLELDSLSPEQLEIALALRDKAGHLNDAELFRSLNLGQSIIVESSGNPTSIDWLKKEAEKHTYDVHILFVLTSLEKALERNSKRERKIKEDELKKAFERVYSNLDHIKQIIHEDHIHIIDNNEKVVGQDFLKLQKEIMVTAANMLGRNVR